MLSGILKALILKLPLKILDRDCRNLAVLDVAENIPSIRSENIHQMNQQYVYH